MVAAQAMEAELRRQAPDEQVIVHDVLQSTNAFFRALYAQGYLGLVNHAPAAMGMLYDATDRPNRYFRRNLRAIFQNLNSRPAMRMLCERRPRLIVNTHFLPAELVAHLRQQGRLDCPQVTVTTDFETHKLWAQPRTERYYTATADGKAYLQTWGVDAASVLVTGIPVRAAFTQLGPRRDARIRCGLDADRPVVLLLCGGFGVGPTAELFAQLLQLPAETQIAAVTGRNERLREKLERMSTRATRVAGFTDAMHDWMQSADLVVTKPGGLTAAEALVCRLPLVIVNPIPGQETRNSDFLLENGAAVKVNNPRLLCHRVARLLGDAARLAALRSAAERLARPDAAARIAADALSLL